MLDGQGYDISCDLVMKVSVRGQVRSRFLLQPVFLPVPLTLLSSLNP